MSDNPLDRICRMSRFDWRCCESIPCKIVTFIYLLVMINKLAGYKTYIVAALTIGYAIGGLALGKLDFNSAVELISPVLAAAFVRHGIKTTAAK